ncbi:hypothetical protein NCER_102440 [Vairimorpha ceranae BRL01]|uniref:Uncharacterized protein n=1 Tax=Vairimorpha ceranae (strain BRL01) TaxID=578460 RepID=C4VC10_VAIC1|nr:hypothetical protein NCER_102440 [Vairimorpha ceranae BRL01]
MLFWLQEVFCSTQILDHNEPSDLRINISSTSRAYENKGLGENVDIQQKSQEKRSLNFAVEHYSSKSFSSSSSNVEFNNILTENKKKLKKLKDKFFVNVRKKSPTYLIHFNLKKNFKYRSIRWRIFFHLNGLKLLQMKLLNFL